MKKFKFETPEIIEAYCQADCPVPDAIEGILRNLQSLSPGYDGQAIARVIQNIELLLDGGVIVLTGESRRGKTVAAWAAAILYHWHTSAKSFYRMELADFRRDDMYRKALLAAAPPVPPTAEEIEKSRQKHERSCKADRELKVVSTGSAMRTFLMKRFAVSSPVEADYQLALKERVVCEKNNRSSSFDSTAMLKKSLRALMPEFKFMTAKQILDHAYEQGNVRGIAYHPELLVIDDFGREHFRQDSGWGVAQWEEIVDLRCVERLPTVITTNLSQPGIAGRYGDRIFNRLFEWGAVATITDPHLGFQTPEGVLV
ncbi:hypothetical protein J7K50_02185 [bacterium]|nr:hypothetical protein [bacterium]